MNARIGVDLIVEVDKWELSDHWKLPGETALEVHRAVAKQLQIVAAQALREILNKDLGIEATVSPAVSR